MSEFEYSDLSSDDDFSAEAVFGVRKIKFETTARITRELRLHYSNLFIDSFNLIDLFVKSKKFTYDSFLECFDTSQYHQIYYMLQKKKQKVGQNFVSPHHYISTTQDALAIASKFLRSSSKEARIGAVYLLYTLYKTQPLKTYIVKIKMEPLDYNNTKKLVDECLNEGLVHPAYYFYDLDIKKQIIICSNAVSPCLEENYPRREIRKHLGRAADRYFKIKYEESNVFDPFSKLKLMEDQMRSELTYINKLSEMSLGREVTKEYKPEILQALMQIENSSKYNNIEGGDQNYKNSSLKQTQFKNRKTVAFPGKNENILHDMVEIPVQQFISKPKNKRRSKKNQKSKNAWKRMIKDDSDSCEMSTEQNKPIKSMLLSDMIETDSSDSSFGTDDEDNTNFNYEDMIWSMIGEETHPNEMSNEEDIKVNNFDSGVSM
ncbi:Hypothetical protein CINCED_3A011717 [Cinara cedri]|uniref:snRNA-activating protein complex subunit 1 n=1 Tax=Cinara cedri TaxID=506608 RepID=A0A5E4M3N8_9HEMI|nr:Hypothetical protein CINCED_3A011717 [Cinara cedri]